MKRLVLLLATAGCLLGQSWPIPYGTGHTNQITTLPLEVQADFSARKAGTANNAQIYAYSGNSTANNYERARIGYNGSAIGLHAEKGGTGTYRNLAFYTSATDRWYVDATSGDFWPGLNNTYAIGTASQRTTNVYTGLVNMSSGGGLDWDTRGKLRFTADGAAYFSKNAGAGNGNWSRLGFGGNTSNNPALWLNGTNLTLAIYTDQAVPVSLTLGNIMPLGTGLLSTSIGSGASASADTTVAVGEGANASAATATALGSYSVASGPSSVAIGYNATASGDSSVAIGIGSSVSRTNLIQLGGTNVDTSVGRNLQVAGNAYITGTNYANYLVVTNGVSFPGLARGIMIISNGTTSLTLSSTPSNVTNFTHFLKGVHTSGDLAAGTITLTNAGTYQINASISFDTSTAAVELVGCIYVDSDPSGFRFHRDISVGSNSISGNAACFGIVTVTAGQKISLKLSTAASETVVVQDAQIMVVQLF